MCYDSGASVFWFVLMFAVFRVGYLGFCWLCRLGVCGVYLVILCLFAVCCFTVIAGHLRLEVCVCYEC